MIKFENVTKRFGNEVVNRNINLTINDGEVISIIGPSGAGKSTLMRMINLLEIPSEGKIFIDDEEVTAPGYDIVHARKMIGMVFQDFHLFKHITVIENIMRPQIDVLYKSIPEAYKVSKRLLDLVSLSEKAYSYPSELSGGQKQRVAIARALAMDPKIILFDEPTSALDPNMVEEVEEVIGELAQMGKTMVVVTHEMEFARKISNRIIYMDENTIYEEGTPDEIFDNPKRAKTKRFVNNLKLLTINIENKDKDFWEVGAEIARYANKNHISPKSKTRLNLAFEELVREIILDRLDEPKINVVIEYSKKTDVLKMTVKYNGDYFDPKDTDNDLSYHVLSSATSEIKYSELKDDETYNNLVEIIIKQASENK
ncbi:MAG: amino acid ABC transporter ATP-binding protein [Lachnospiraceae bacterium]|nr:amino acid ABC transporter ATP-binding protein [Lachnospiraceae bacterium]